MSSLEELLPARSWLTRYMDFTSGLQACPQFRFFAMASALGALCANRIYIQRGDHGLLPKLFPNLWTLLIGPPGRGSKTQTVNMATDMLEEASVFTRILSDKLTPESLVKALSEPIVSEQGDVKIRDATGLIKAPEASVLFGRQSYNLGMISLIADLYDFRPQWTAETVTRGQNVLYNNVISILAASTPDWLETLLPTDAFTGGFMSRFVIVDLPPDYDVRVGWPMKPSEAAGRDELVNDLSRLESLQGEFRWSEKGKQAFIEDYEQQQFTGETQLDAYLVREPEQVLKLAMLLAISEGRLVLRGTDYRSARAITDLVRKQTFERIESLTTAPRMKTTAEIKTLLAKFTTMTEKELLRRLAKTLDHGPRQFQEALGVLVQTGEVERVKGSSPKNLKYRLVEEGRNGNGTS